MRAESLALQFLGTFAGAEEVHAGLADSHHLLGVCGGEAMYFGERVLERRVMVRLVFERQTIRPRHTAMPVEHGLIGVYCERRVHVTWMIEGHLTAVIRCGSSQPQSMIPQCRQIAPAPAIGRRRTPGLRAVPSPAPHGS